MSVSSNSGVVKSSRIATGLAFLVALVVGPTQAAPSACVVSDDGANREIIGACAATSGPGPARWQVVAPLGTVGGWTVTWRRIDGTVLTRDRCDVNLPVGGTLLTGGVKCVMGGFGAEWSNGGSGGTTSLGVLVLASASQSTKIPVLISLSVRAHKNGTPFRGSISATFA